MFENKVDKYILCCNEDAYPSFMEDYAVLLTKEEVIEEFKIIKGGSNYITIAIQVDNDKFEDEFGVITGRKYPTYKAFKIKY